MSKKLNTKSLLVITIVLAVILLLSKYQSEKSENTFREEFIKIDTSSVQQFLIYPKAEKGKEIKITRTKTGWELQNDKVKTFADSSAVRSLIANFADMKSLSLGAQNKEGWNDLQVSDTTGTRLKIICKDKSYEIMVGKFGYNSASRNGISYVRHVSEEATYAVGGFLSLNVNQGFNAWRLKTFIKGNKNNWTSLTYSYPGDSSFVLNRQNNSWKVNGAATDSLFTDQYLSRISNLPCSEFADDFSPASTPIYTLTIQGNNQLSPIVIRAYQDLNHKYVLNSSLNNDAYFSDAQGSLINAVFVSSNSFMKHAENKKKK